MAAESNETAKSQESQQQSLEAAPLHRDSQNQGLENQNLENQGFEIPAEIDSSQVFRLINQILPLEVCLYHRIVPLRQAKGTLALGMVDPYDEEALSYAERLVAYQGLLMAPQPLAGSIHQSLLSAYLNHVGKPANANNIDAALLDRTEVEGERDLELIKSDDEAMDSAELACPEQPLTPADGIGAESTLTAETPDTTDPVEPESLEQRAAALAEQPDVGCRTTLHLEQLTMSSADVSNQDGSDQNGKNQTNSGEAIPSAMPGVIPGAMSQPPVPPRPAIALPPLQVSIHHLMEPIEAIAQLPAPQFLAELWGRILAGGVSRILLGSNGKTGRIAWERNGVAQIALGPIKAQTFQALMAELKATVGLPAAPPSAPIQRRVLRACDGHPLLLKLNLEPTAQAKAHKQAPPGEKLQIHLLRGTRLIAHEQQRLESLQSEAIAAATLLQHKLQKIETMQQVMPTLEPRFEELEQLTTLVHQNVEHLPTRG